MSIAGQTSAKNNEGCGLDLAYGTKKRATQVASYTSLGNQRAESPRGPLANQSSSSSVEESSASLSSSSSSSERSSLLQDGG